MDDFFDDDIPMLDTDEELFESQLLMETFFEHIHDSNDDLVGDLTQDFFEATQVFEKLPLYYQIGSGFENRPGTSTTGPPWIENNPQQQNVDGVIDAIMLAERSRRTNKKYMAQEITFRAHVQLERLPPNLQGVPMISIPEIVRELFLEIIRRTTAQLKQTDLIRFCIQAEGLDKPISTYLMSVADLTIEKVFSAVMKVLQSKQKVKLDTEFFVDVLTIQRPVGAGRTNRRVINIAQDRLKKRSVLSIPSDNQGLCCAKAIVTAIAHLENDTATIRSLKDKRRPALLKKAKDLHEAAKVPLGPCTYKEVKQFEQHLDIQIVVLDSQNLNQVGYKDRDRPRRITLWLHEGHYDVVKSLTGFYGTNYYCLSCDKAYQDNVRHHCPNTCYICLRPNCIPGETIRCQDCDRLCRSKECYDVHRELVGNQIYSICNKIYQCRKCSQLIRRNDCPKEMHRCGTTKCPSCKKFIVAAEHQCFLQKIEPQKPSEQLIFFDFETDQSSGEHQVNFAVAQYTDGSEKVFRGYSACKEFCSWLFSPTHRGFTAIAHNMKGFDGQFVLAWLLEQGIEPEVIPNGSMLMTIHHKTLGIRLIDSINFLPMALSKIPTCFGLSELKKGYFPHLFNTQENQKYVGPLPEIRFYSPQTMTAQAKQTFLTWYELHKNDEFNFQEEIETYCRSDVDILRRCCIEFRKLFLEIADVDPYRYITIASSCMAAYRWKHIPKDAIAMIPVKGYINRTNYSPDSIRWLDFVAKSQNVEIQHALNHTGEFKVAGVSVDGICHSTKTIYQYHGCFYHGCSLCYDGDVKHPLAGVSMSVLKQKTADTTLKLRNQGFQVVEIWEHEFLKLKNEDATLQEFIKTHKLQDRLNPRDAFFGGRTNAVKLFYEGEAKYFDFTSLYPWVNKYCVYPVGHPQIITEGFKDVEEYFGFIHCKILPPRKLYLPVLPHRSKKLMFPLCRTCTENQQQTHCNHSDNERALTGTWVSEEIKLARKKGYQILDIYEVYHFADRTDSLFKTYINLFLKIKQESSGWPADCVSEDDQAAYIKEYEEREGIRLNPNAIAKNPGRRQVAKLALNSLWGRFGMNTNKGQLTFVTKIADFNRMLVDSTKTIKDMYLPNPEVAALHWSYAKDFVAQDISTNIFIAAFTTAWARIKLYGEMENLGDAVLYHDTDSIIYATNGTNDPPLGNFLGDFTDELNGDTITTFVSGGPKNYSFQTNSGKTYCKIRGFTLNVRNSEKLNFLSLKSLICSLDRSESIAVHNPSKITREAKRRRVVNKEETKLYRIVYDKRVIQSDLSTLPYGY